MKKRHAWYVEYEPVNGAEGQWCTYDAKSERDARTIALALRSDERIGAIAIYRDGELFDDSY